MISCENCTYYCGEGYYCFRAYFVVKKEYAKNCDDYTNKRDDNL